MTSAQDDRRRNSQESLTASLLEEPIPLEGSGRFAPYSTTAALLLSLFLAYHVVTVVLYNLPTVEVAQTLRAALDRPLAIKSYMAVNNNPPGWGLFAPNANQANYFTKVLVEDAAGRSRDMQADIYGRRAYPYLVYDRLGNLNRRVAQGETSLRPFYAAWFCREWERTHRGEPARAVVLVRRWTRIPPPEDAYATGGFHPMGLFPNEDQTVRFECDSTPGARLPDELRRRFALPARPRREMPAEAPSRGTEAASDAAEPSRDGY